jgi:hypothetical protein
MQGYLVIEAREREISLLLGAVELAVERQRRLLARRRRQRAQEGTQATGRTQEPWPTEQDDLDDLVDMQQHFSKALAEIRGWNPNGFRA